MAYDYNLYFLLSQDPASPTFRKRLKGMAYHGPCDTRLKFSEEPEGYYCEQCGERGWLVSLEKDRKTGRPLIPGQPDGIPTWELTELFLMGANSISPNPDGTFTLTFPDHKVVVSVKSVVTGP